MFYRKIENTLNEYYEHPSDPILVITGARQIGKSFIVRETASKRFQNYVEANMQDDFDGDSNFKDVRTTRDFYL